MDPSDPPTFQKLKNTLPMDAATFIAHQTTENSLNNPASVPLRLILPVFGSISHYLTTPWANHGPQ